jgi:hypothetical protein
LAGNVNGFGEDRSPRLGNVKEIGADSGLGSRWSAIPASNLLFKQGNVNGFGMAPARQDLCVPKLFTFQEGLLPAAWQTGLLLPILFTLSRL